MSDIASLIGPRRDRTSHGDVAVHDHVCGIYDNREDQYEAACRFLKAGLNRKEQCLYIAEHQTPAEFISFLESRGVNVNAATRNGSFQVLSGEEVRLKLGGFTPQAMLSFLVQSEKNALQKGFSAFRWGADMTWLRKDDIEPVDMFSFEAELNQLLAERELVGFCQYAMDDFRSELLIAAVETHPLLVYNEVVCDNFYFIPPEEYLKPQFSDLKLKRLLYNVVSRERLMSNFLSG